MATEQTILSERQLDKAAEVLSGLETDALAQLLSASADVVLLIDGKGVIIDLAFSGDD